MVHRPCGELKIVLPLVEKTGNIQTKMSFGDVQLHVEWRTPGDVKGTGQGRGNSGVFLMGKYEVQVLDSYNNETYYNGQAGSIYKQYIPLVNASTGPGTWQTYDIIFTAPGFNDDKTLKTPGYITVIHNGVLIQNHVELKGPTEYIGKPVYKFHDQQAATFASEPWKSCLIQEHLDKRIIGVESWEWWDQETV